MTTATPDARKPWIAEAQRAGRQVPAWIAERATTRKQFEQWMTLRERAVPATQPSGAKLSLEQAAELAQVDPHELAWACEQHGRCDTDHHTVRPNDDGSYTATSRSGKN